MTPKPLKFATTWAGIRTQAEVAKMLGVSRARVAQVEKAALKKMRLAWVRMYGTEAA